VATALNLYIRYDNAAKIAKRAYPNDTTLKEEVLNLGLMTAAELDAAVKPEEMITPKA